MKKIRLTKKQMALEIVTHRRQVNAIKKANLVKSLDQHMAEEATGLTENPFGLGAVYSGGEREVSPNQAKVRLLNGETIEIPNAGSGSYQKVFLDLLGFKEVRVLDWTSSAGDWAFGVFDGTNWHQASQTNRYPYHGFKYSIDLTTCKTFEALESLVFARQ